MNRLTSTMTIGRTVLALVAASACGDKSAPDSAAASPAAPASDTARVITMSAAQVQHGAIRWTAAETRETSGTLEAPGQLVPNEDRTARLGAPLQSRVVAVHVQAGARVGRGQALVTLQSPEASMARAEYSKAAADLSARRVAATYARSARERAERLLAAKAALGGLAHTMLCIQGMDVESDNLWDADKDKCTDEIRCLYLCLLAAAWDDI